jgi:hypothetical protein
MAHPSLGDARPGPTLSSPASAGHGSYLGRSCRQGDGARGLKMTLSGSHLCIAATEITGAPASLGPFL